MANVVDKATESNGVSDRMIHHKRDSDFTNSRLTRKHDLETTCKSTIVAQLRRRWLITFRNVHIDAAISLSFVH